MQFSPSRALGAKFVACLLAACGRGNAGGTTTTPPPTPPPVVVEKPATCDEAARFLAQASFGAVDNDSDRLMSVGDTAWIDQQFALPARTRSSSPSGNRPSQARTSCASLWPMRCRRSW